MPLFPPPSPDRVDEEAAVFDTYSPATLHKIDMTSYPYLEKQDISPIDMQGSTLDVPRMVPTLRNVQPPTPANPLQKINPGAMAMIGFAVTMTSVSICQLQIGTIAAPDGVPALVPVFYLFGGLMLWTSSITAAFVGKPIEHVAFAVFGSGFLVQAMANQPTQMFQQTLFNDPTLGTAARDASGLFAIVSAFFGYIMFVCSFQLSVVDVLWNALLPTANVFLGISMFTSARHNVALSSVLTRLGGLCGLSTGLLAWYIFAGIMFELAGVPLQLPMGKLGRSKQRA